MDDKPLTLRRTVIDGKPIDDDFEVLWDGIPVGRILRQPGVPMGKPNVWWGISFGGRPQRVNHRGVVATLDKGKARFKLAWSAVRPTITEQNIARERERYRASLTQSASLE